MACTLLLVAQGSAARLLQQNQDDPAQFFQGQSVDFEAKYCKQHADEKVCHNWCKQHPKKDVCQPFIKKACKKNPDKDFCNAFLKDKCPKHADKDFCKDWCEQHPKKCGSEPAKNDCIHAQNNLAQTRSVGSTNGPTNLDVTNAFNQVGATSQNGGWVPGKGLPIEDLKPLLKQLGVELNKKDLKHVKKQLNNDGYFSLVSFFFWWTDFAICNAFTG